MSLLQDMIGYVMSGVTTPQKIASDGIAKALRGLRDGTLSVADFKLICALEGVLMQANVGSLVTPIAGHVAVTQLQPEGNVDVPVGTGVIMLPPNVYLETSAGTLTRVLMASIQALMGDGTSNAATVGPASTRTDQRGANTASGKCRARQSYTVNGSALAPGVSQVEHWRSGYPFADATGAPVKQFSPPLDAWPFPVLIGPASFQVYWGATTTAPTGWAQLEWIELPSSQLV